MVGLELVSHLDQDQGVLSIFVRGHLVGQQFLVFDELRVLNRSPQNALRFEDFASARIFLVLGFPPNQNLAIRLEAYHRRCCPCASLTGVPQYLAAIQGDQTDGRVSGAQVNTYPWLLAFRQQRSWVSP